MTTAVKIFAHKGVMAAPNVLSRQPSTDSVYMLTQPYLAREAISASGTATSSSSATAPSGTTLLHVEVADGTTVRYEINPPHRSTAADANSPSLSGKTQLSFGEGWTISVIEA